MSLPASVSGLTIRYVEQGELKSETINFSSVYRTYTSQGQNMVARLYTPDALASEMGDICLVTNDFSSPTKLTLAASQILVAIAQYRMVKHFDSESLRGVAWPLKKGMMEDFEDGSVRPNGLCACLRYVSSARYSTTDVAIQPLFDYPVPE